MHRRTVLTLMTLGAFSGTGCLSTLGSGCPNPDIENELTFENRKPSGNLVDSGEEGAFLVTEPDEVDRFDSTDFEGKDEQWVRETNFERSAILGIQIGSSGTSTPLQILGVGREAVDTIHAYTCIKERGRTDDWVLYNSLLRIQYDDQVPKTAKLTHWEDGEKRNFE